MSGGPRPTRCRPGRSGRGTPRAFRSVRSPVGLVPFPCRPGPGSSWSFYSGLGSFFFSRWSSPGCKGSPQLFSPRPLSCTEAYEHADRSRRHALCAQATALIPVSVKKHSFQESLPAKQQQKLLSSPRFGVCLANLLTRLLLWRSVFVHRRRYEQMTLYYLSESYVRI